MNRVAALPDVLTLEEAAEYLRSTRVTVKRQAALGLIPGRQLNGQWRFLKAALADWLRSCDSRTVLLQQAGAFADDETLARLRAEIYTQRGRSEAEPGTRR